MKYLMIFIVLMSMYACKHKRFYRKYIVDKNIIIKWFYYSNNGNGSGDFIVISPIGGIEKEIIDADDVVCDIKLIGNQINIKLVEPSKRELNTKTIPNSIFGYQIVLDSSGVPSDIFKIPDGK